MVQEAGLIEQVLPEERSMMTVLEPGRYLIELAVAPGLELDTITLTSGLVVMGWDKLCLDPSEPGKHRFVGETERAIAIADTPAIQWTRTHRIGVDVFGELEYRLKPIEVKSGATYEMLFITRTKSHRTREDVRKALEEMSFRVDVLSLLKRDMRVPGYPGASAGLWFGIATWKGADGYVNGDDAFVFEALEETVQASVAIEEAKA